MILIEQMQQELQELEAKSNLRKLPGILHEGRDVIVNGQRMLNLSSNDYLGLANDIELRRNFLETLTPETFLPTSSSSRLLTGNFTACNNSLRLSVRKQHWYSTADTMPIRVSFRL